MSTIAAISTAQGLGGIGIVRLSGKDSLKIADKIFIFNKNNKLLNLDGYTAKYGKVFDKKGFIDEAIALVFKTPHSYTGEDVVEISCHGGLFIVRRLLRSALDAGAELAMPGEFTKRAFLNGKINLFEAESVMDLISAKSEKANNQAFSLKFGNSNKNLLNIKNLLLDISSELSFWADYPEENNQQINIKLLINKLGNINLKIKDLIKNYNINKIIKNGVNTIIIGKPNVGKSTLMNLLSGYEKSIVTNIPGTTRDIIEENIILGDIPILLTDTAGIRNTDDIIEKIGVERAKKSLENSDLIFLILDGSKELTDQDFEILNLTKNNKNKIVIINKIDLVQKINISEILKFTENIVYISAINGENLENLKNLVYKIIGLSNFDSFDDVISSERQFEILKKVNKIIFQTQECLKEGVTLDAITVLIQEAIQVFLEFTGERASEAIIDQVFSKFCVGK